MVTNKMLYAASEAVADSLTEQERCALDLHAKGWGGL
jgi:hypothetical protein